MPTPPPIASHTVTLADGSALFVRDDTHAAPWDTPKTVLLLHAEAEHSGAWFGWVTKLAGRFRVVRPDQRGHGRSTGAAASDLDRLVADALAVLDAVGSDSAHVIAARYAAPIALRLAAKHPERVTTLVLCNGEANPAAALGDKRTEWQAALAKDGTRAWAEAQLPERLGNDADANTIGGWAGLIGAADPQSLAAYLAALPALDATADLPQVACPTLVVTTDGSARTPVEATIAWERQIGPSELTVFTGTGDHVAASHVADAASAAVTFWKKHAKGAAKRERPDADDRQKRRAERQAARTEKPAA